MSSRYEPELPRTLPTEVVKVDGEEFTFTTYEGKNNTVLEQKEYEISKAPIQRIEEVRGVFDGTNTVFEKSVDYELSSDRERIVWLDAGVSPDPGTIFEVDYRSESVLGRYIEAHTDELDTVEKELNELQDAKFVDTASGTDLDEVGKIFGTLGRRLGRDDTEYRIFLKSVVQSFVSRGTKNDIKTALSAATDVPLADISINENFADNSYEVNILAATPITGSLVEQVSEIADPSGVEQSRTRFTIPADEMQINDAVNFSFGTSVDGGSLGSNDGVVVPPAEVVSDEQGVTGATSSSQTIVSWDKGSWDTMHWSKEHN